MCQTNRERNGDTNGAFTIRYSYLPDRAEPGMKPWLRFLDRENAHVGRQGGVQGTGQRRALERSSE